MADKNKDTFESAQTTETEETNDVEQTEESPTDTDVENNPVSPEETFLGDLPSGEVSPDTSAVDVSSGDSSSDTVSADVSDGDVSGNSPGSHATPSVSYGIPETLEVTCTCHEEAPPLLWESDITQYTVTDGLLLLILITLVLDIVIFRKK